MGPTDFESETLPLLSQVEARLTGQKPRYLKARYILFKYLNFCLLIVPSLDSAVESPIQNTKVPGLNLGWGPIKCNFKKRNTVVVLTKTFTKTTA